jgi:hypothetical protein
MNLNPPNLSNSYGRDFTSPLNNNGFNEYYNENNLILAGNDNEIFNSRSCSVIHGNGNLISNKYNCHVIGDYLGKENITDLEDGSFNVGCYNGINSWGKITAKRGGAEINGALLLSETNLADGFASIEFKNDRDVASSRISLGKDETQLNYDSFAQWAQFNLGFVGFDGASGWYSSGWFLSNSWEAFVDSQENNPDSGDVSFGANLNSWIYLNLHENNKFYDFKRNVVDSTPSIFLAYVNVSQKESNNSFWAYLGDNDPETDATWEYEDKWVWFSQGTFPFAYVHPTGSWIYFYQDEDNQNYVPTFDNISNLSINTLHTIETIGGSSDIIIDSQQDETAANLIVEGKTKSIQGFVVGSKEQNSEVTWTSGKGPPTSSGQPIEVQQASKGSLYTDINGSNGNVLWVKESSWVPK